jgi:hypothetical protein
MICYMPFIDIEGQLLDKLTATLGTVSIYHPDPGMGSDPMLAAARGGRLDLRSGHGIDPDHLARAVLEFKAWADLHGGDIADLAGLSKTMQGRPPLMDDTNPTAIGDQIRHFGEQNPREAADPVFQAALFLSMAQQFDRQQVAVSRDLGKVQAMEQVMLARLAGDGRDPEEGIGGLPDTGIGVGLPDVGGYMTAMRVRSWAELALKDTGHRSFLLYVTSSPAVLDYLMDQFEQVHGPLRVCLHPGDNGGGHGNRSVVEALERLACSKDPASVSADCFRESAGEGSCDDLTIYALPGISPSDFPKRLLANRKRTDPGLSAGQGAPNALVGLLEK